MFRHGPSCLRGPVTRDRWLHAARPVPGEEYGSGHERETTQMHPAHEHTDDTDTPFRAELVERVRREIADGTYDTPDKWQAALNRLIDELEQ